MQLKRFEPVRATVTAVTFALLGPAVAARADDAGKIDSSLLIYSETNRVKAAESVIDYSAQIDDWHSYKLGLTLDGLTGASPNGATPASTVQSFTGSSGKVGFTAQPGKIPLDNSFRDMRLGFDGDYIVKLDRLTTGTVGGHLSFERDYASFGINGAISRDFFQKNTTLGASASASHDVVSPIGGAPTPLTPMPPPTATSTGGGEGVEGEGGGGSGPPKGKDVLDAVLSINQVLDRFTLVRFDYSLGLTSGYLNDPYKLLSVVQDQTGVSPGDPVDYLYESRPRQRTRQALFGELHQYLFGLTIGASYRYYKDDWGVHSRTVDIIPRIPLPHGHAIEPHYRWYRQSAADFYRTYLVDGQPLPGHASADSRLAAFDAITLGLKYLWPLDESNRLSVSAEYYAQTAPRGPPNPIGVLSQYDLFPEMHVFMIRLGFSHDL